MARLLAALAALLLGSAALAEDKKTDPPPASAATEPAAAQQPGAAQTPPSGAAQTPPSGGAPQAPAGAGAGAGAAAAPELDAKTRAAIQREIEKAKEDIRNEVRAEIQGAQSAAEFLGTVAEGPKLEFFTVDGYFRFRGQLMVNFDITGVKDASGSYLFPVPLQNPGGHNTLDTANMRLRLEPTLNVSEHVRVRMQVDVLDNYVLGSNTSSLSAGAGNTYPVPFYGSNAVLTPNDPRTDRPAVDPKAVWGEIQTPIGLLSFGRMPSQWGLGILTNAGTGIDADYGDKKDRIQFALPPVPTPIGRLTFVPILDFDSEGVLYGDTRFGAGTGQSIDAVNEDDGRTYAIKVASLDTDDEIRRKHERNEASWNYGAYYNYRTQKWYYPQWDANGYGGSYEPGCGASAGSCIDPAAYGDTPTAVHRSAHANVLSLWFRYLGPRLRVETEVVGIDGHVKNPSSDPTVALSEVLIRQFGATLVTDWKILPNKLALGGEFGVASGDSAPGFGNVPSRVNGPSSSNPGGPPPYGSVEGAQWREGSDNTIRNFQFNPAYRVDLILWRHILGAVTDAMYFKQTLRWDILPGLRFDEAIIYSRAMYAQSTPSAKEDPNHAGRYLSGSGDANLGIEFDTTLRYTSGDGFGGWLSWGLLQPFGGLSYNDAKRARAQYLELGLAAKF